MWYSVFHMAEALQPNFQGLLRLDRLMAAWEKVRANRGGPGGDGVGIDAFARNALERLNRLRLDVLSGAYWPGPIRRLEIAKPQGGWRPLSIPCVGDRVLQAATAMALTPLMEAEFEPASYGYRKNRSVAMAVAKVASLRRQGFVWTVDADIRRFFEAVPHEPLIARLQATLRDERIVDLIALWLEHSEPDGRGLSQGSPLSPLLANFYLDAADEILDGRDVRLVRFADDFVLLCRTEGAAQRALADAQETLAALGLELNLEKTRVRSYDQSLAFLGRVFVRSLVLDGAANTGEEADRAARPVTELLPEADPLLEPRGPLSGSDGRLAPRLRTLYVYQADSLLTADGPHFCVRSPEGEVWRGPAGRVDQVELGPAAQVDAGALRLAAAAGACVHLNDGWGHAGARLEPTSVGNARLHMIQARTILDTQVRLRFAAALVAGRLANQRALLKRLNRRRKKPQIDAAAASIARIMRRLVRAKDPASLMGFEGEATALYWPALGACLDHDFTLTRRVRRPPPDPVNLTLSVLAGRLTNDLETLVRRSGLHPGFGVLHAIADGDRETLALDLVEIFRAPLAEGLAVYVLNNRMLRNEHFVQDGEVCRLVPEGLKALIRAYEGWLDRAVRSPFSDSDVLWRGLMVEQIEAVREAFERGEPPNLYRMDY